MNLDPLTSMVPLTTLLDVAVRDASGHPTGWIRDLVARVGPGDAQVTGVLLGDAHDRWVLPGSDLEASRLDRLSLRHGLAEDVRASILRESDELLLARDVLDCRVYVVSERQTARVGEVWLRVSPSQPPSVAGVEVGVGVLLRRLGPRRRRRPSSDVHLLRLDDVHLVSHRGHIVQLSTDASPARHLSPHDLAHLLTHLPARLAVDVLHHVPAGRSHAAVEHLHPRVRSQLRRAEQGRRKSRRRFRRTAGWRTDLPADDEAIHAARRTWPQT
jgi:hypothetical protein